MGLGGIIILSSLDQSLLLGSIRPVAFDSSSRLTALNKRLWRHNLNQMASGKPGAVHACGLDHPPSKAS
jgi:hypothetical protein